MKLAIIGASKGQLQICKKARDMGIQTVSFAWEKGAVCKSIVDKFYPISITEKDEIVKICKDENVDGVISNGSDLTSEVVSYVSEKLSLHGNKYEIFMKLKNKEYIRNLSNTVCGLEKVNNYIYSDDREKMEIFPCVVKPVVGVSKQGVSFVKNEEEFHTAIKYAREQSREEILVEEFIGGNEISVESISFEGKHYVIQITDKDSSGAPHFVEVGHHQPSLLPDNIKDKIRTVIPDLLDTIGFENGATHIEMKIYKDNLYLIEINLRGGGDEISNQLVELSTGYDYIKGMIQVALGNFQQPKVSQKKYSGIYFLCNQTEYLLPSFIREKDPAHVVEKCIDSLSLHTSTSNYDRNGYIIYCSDHKLLNNEL